MSVNYHFTRQCNYSCGFCFHTAKTSFVLPIEDAKRGLKMLVDAGMKKINFSGMIMKPATTYQCMKLRTTNECAHARMRE